MTEKNANVFNDFVNQAQTRISAVEADARKAVAEVVERGEKARKDLEALLGKLEHTESVKKAQEFWGRRTELGDKAEQFRADAIKRLDAVTQRALAALTGATREQVEALVKEIERLAGSIEKMVKRPTTEAPAETPAEPTAQA